MTKRYWVYKGTRQFYIYLHQPNRGRVPLCKLRTRCVYCWKIYRLSSEKYFSRCIFRSFNDSRNPHVFSFSRISRVYSVSFETRDQPGFIFFCSPFSFSLLFFFFFATARPRFRTLNFGAIARCEANPCRRWWLYLSRACDIRITTSRSSVSFRATNPFLGETDYLFFMYNWQLNVA